MLKRIGLFAVLGMILPAAVLAQQPQAAASENPAPNPTTICEADIPPPASQPPDGSGPVLYQIIPCFSAQGNVQLIDPVTYVYYMQAAQKLSVPSKNLWVPYDESIEQILREDFVRLWNTNFLDNLSIETQDYRFANGVVGKIVVYNLEERQRVKIITFTGSKKVEQTKIYDKLKEQNIELRIDTFIDPSKIRKVEGVVRELFREKGFQYATVTHQFKEVQGGPKLVDLTFTMNEGPQVQISRVEFVGNQAVSDGRLRGRMKENKARWFLSFITKRGVYQETKFEEDAERVLEFYRDRGFIRANVGAPELRPLRDSSDGKKRFVELRVPVVEGKRYRVGDFNVDGNTVIKAEALKPLFKLAPNEFYSQKRVRQGFQKAQEMYGSAGYFEFTGFPDFSYRDEPNPAAPEAPKALAAVPEKNEENEPAVVDVTMRFQEGKQYFINRITFIGNTTTRDNVIRREMRLYENGVFNSEALKYSIRRLNQLGYFKALEGPPKDVTVEKTQGADAKVDVRLKLEEQNRNQLTFGAGVSQFDGFFGQLAFSTANFLGRGESLTVSLQSGERAQNYSLGFTEPFLFDRNITGGLNLFRSDVRFISQFTQRTTGGVLTFGFPLGNGFSRMFTNYSYERVRVTDISDFYQDPEVLARNPFLRDALLIGAGGERIISKVVPSYVYNTVDQPIFPTTGRRFTASIDLAGAGGNTNFYKPLVEGVWFMRQNNKMSLGMRGRYEYIRQFTGDRELPIFEKLFLGGEYDVRGFDMRTIGPQDELTGLVLGGNKSLVFNVEQIFTIAQPVRLILFYDAGQVQSGAERLEDGTVRPGQGFSLQDFKTSTGAEVRFFMPVLNVPFRLIFAYNPQRAGVLDNNFRPQKAFQFRFAVGTTF